MLATRVRFSVGSWGRTPLHNTKVGGIETSYHLIWLAVDIHLDSDDDFPVLVFLAGRMGLEVIRSGGVIHIEPGPSLGYGS